MRMILATVILAGSAASALPGEIKVSSGPDANPAQYVGTREISDADLQSRWIPALSWNYGQICGEAPGPAAASKNFTVKVNTKGKKKAETPKVGENGCRDRTTDELMTLWLNGVNNGITDIVSRYEKTKAAQDAVSEVTPLP